MRHRVSKGGLGAALFAVCPSGSGTSALLGGCRAAASPAWALTRISRRFENRRPKTRQGKGRWSSQRRPETASKEAKAGEEPAPEKPEPRKPAAEKAAAGMPPEKPAAEKLAPEKLAPERPAGEKSAGGKKGEEEVTPPQDESALLWLYHSMGLRYVFIFLAVSFNEMALVVMIVLGLRRSNICPLELAADFDAHLRKKQYQEAYDAAKKNDSFLGRVLASGMANLSEGYEAAVEAMQETGEEQTMRLEQRNGNIALIAQIGPMLGLLATVDGIVQAFAVIASKNVTPKPSRIGPRHRHRAGEYGGRAVDRHSLDRLLSFHPQSSDAVDFRSGACQRAADEAVLERFGGGEEGLKHAHSKPANLPLRNRHDPDTGHDFPVDVLLHVDVELLQRDPERPGPSAGQRDRQAGPRRPGGVDHRADAGPGNWCCLAATRWRWAPCGRICSASGTRSAPCSAGSVKDVTVIMRADRDVPAGKVQEVLRICQELGFERFVLRARLGQRVKGRRPSCGLGKQEAEVRA